MLRSENLVQRIQDMIDEFHLLASDVTEQLGACFLRNDATPTRYDGNHVRRIRLGDGVTVDAFFAEVERFYSYQDFRAVRVDPWTSPLGIEARLLQDGYGATGVSTEIVMATDRPLAGRAADLRIETVQDEAGWEALRDLMAADLTNNDSTGETFKLARRRGGAFTWHLAMVKSMAVGHFSERVSGDLGYLEDLMVLPEYRMRGIATALVHHCAESARARGGRTIFLPADANDTPKEMYRRMGFEPVYVFRNYYKKLG